MAEEEWWKKLKELRSKMDGLNVRLLELLRERKEVSEQIGELKAQHGLPVCDSQREEEIIRSMQELGRLHDLPEDSIREIFKLVMGMSKRIQEELIKTAGVNLN